jgi:hypothetical protein
MEGNPSPDISFENEAFYYKGRVWILDDLELKKDILEAEHDSKVAGHMGQDKTIELVRRNFFWSEMEKFIKDYVHSCPECQRNKVARHARYGLLQPLELAYRLWDSISMDFIIDLPVSDSVRNEPGRAGPDVFRPGLRALYQARPAALSVGFSGEKPGRPGSPSGPSDWF